MTDTSFVTPDPVRLAFPSLFEATPVMKGDPKKKFQAVLLIPPGSDLSAYKAAAKAAMIEKWGKAVKLGDNFGLKSADAKAAKGTDGYEEGGFYINTRSDYQPGVVDERAVPVSDPEKVYAGCWVNVFLTAYAWEHPAKGKGVSFGLEAVQKVRDGERFARKADASNVFKPVAGAAAAADGDEDWLGDEDGVGSGGADDAEDDFGL